MKPTSTRASPAPRLLQVEYGTAVRLQEELVRQRAEGVLADRVWYLEHPPVVTWGAKGGLDHLRVEPETLRERGIGLHRSGRGGDVTYHGPGQLVAYPIVHLGQDRDLHRYLRNLEEALIRTLREHGILGERVEGRTGVWVGGSKIAAIGVRVARWVTSHGLALNVDADLGGFDLIVPCGISGARTTSMKRELEPEGKKCPGVGELVPLLHRHLEEVLCRSLEMIIGTP